MRVFGYLLIGDNGNGVLVLMENRGLIFINNQKKYQRHVYLRKTMFRLLEFLLEKGRWSLQHDEMIMRCVWETYGLKASAPRLWQVINELKKRLCALGISEDFIMRIERRGYMVDKKICEPVYIRAAYDLSNRLSLTDQQASGMGDSFR